jgi:alkaline phosphatase
MLNLRERMLRPTFLSLSLFAALTAGAQSSAYSTLSAHAHNDYEHPVPFLTAYYRHYGSIEADVFERNGQLFTAHNEEDIRPERTLEKLYLQPLQELIRKNGGTAFKNSKDTLQLMIDFKTTGVPTLTALVKILERYPEITKNPTVIITISGDQPVPAQWDQYPAFIHFDGKREGTYTTAQLKRIPMYSVDVKAFTSWNGKGLIVKAERDNIQHWIDSVHHTGKKVRFWGTADNVNTWKTLMNMGANYIGTDLVEDLATYLTNRKNLEYNGTAAPHTLYPARYVNNDSLTEVKNVILLIGDGMGLAQIYAGFTGNRGQLNLLQMRNIGFSKTYSADSYITDSAGGGTAMATGHKTNNRYIGVDATGVRLNPIPDIIAPKGYKSALISAGDITDATPAAFYGHVPERSLEDSIAADFLSSPVSIMIGGGAKHFNERKDRLDVAAQLRTKGYVFSTRLEDLDTIRSSKYIVLDKRAELSMLSGRGNFLTHSLEKSIATLRQNNKGFFVMAEGAQIDYGGHVNNMSYVTTEMMDFDAAIGAAMKFADEDGHTLVIVTADHETGGLSLLDGNISHGYVDGNFSSNDHSAVMVPVFAYGPHSLDFRGVYENTEIFAKIIALLK